MEYSNIYNRTPLNLLDSNINRSSTTTTNDDDDDDDDDPYLLLKELSKFYQNHY